jgi:hypothetical protein
MTPAGLSKEEQAQVQQYLTQNLVGPVAIEVWTRKESTLVRTDRDPCTHCEDVIAVARQLAALHPGLSVTLYDLDRHASRAEEAGIDRPPLTVLRGRQGREFRITGLWSGLLFPPSVDAIALLSAGVTPLTDETKEKLAAVEEDVTLEVMGTAYDPYSAYMLRLVAGLAVESRHVRASFTQLGEFPLLALTRSVDEIPVVTLNNKRYVGTWDGPELAEQISRAASGDEEPVVRANVFSGPFFTDEEIARRAAAQAGQGRQEPPQTSSGLYVPGR